MKLNYTVSLTLVASLALSACSMFGDDGIFRDRGENYRDAKIEKPIKLPADVAKEKEQLTQNEEFAIVDDERELSLKQEYKVPRPEPLTQALREEAVKINTLAQERWITVADAPGIVWPKVKGFLNYNGIQVQQSDVSEGIIETAWLKPNKSDEVATNVPEQERYKFSVQRGVQADTAEIKVIQNHNKLAAWPARSDDLAREQVMVKALAQFLADSAGLAPVSLTAQRKMSSQARVFLEGEDTESPYLRLELDYNRAWASTDKALQLANFTVMERKLDDGFFMAQWSPAQEKKQSFFGKMFSAKKKVSKSYLVLLKKVAKEKSIIIIQDGTTGQKLPAPEALQLLKMIKNNLS